MPTQLDPHESEADQLVIHIKPHELPARLQMSWEADLVPIIHGGPGIGKTHIHYQVGALMGLPVISTRAATREPTAIAGMPIPDLQAGFVRWLVDEQWPQGPCIWFFDELNRAPMLTQNACYQLFDDKCIGSKKLPEGVLLSVAVNREQDGGGVIRMAQALNNRFVHFNMEPDAESWIAWAPTAGIDPLITAFISFRPNMLYSFSRDDQAWPSPRQWEFLSRVVKQNPDHDTLKQFVFGTVGHTCCSEFMAFADQYRALVNISIEQIMKNPDRAEIPQEMSAVYAVAAALAQRIDKTNFDKLLRYLVRLDPEYTVFAVRQAYRRDKSICETKAFVDWSVKYHEII